MKSGIITQRDESVIFPRSVAKARRTASSRQHEMRENRVEASFIPCNLYNLYGFAHTHTYIHTYIHVYTYVCVQRIIISIYKNIRLAVDCSRLARSSRRFDWPFVASFHGEFPAHLDGVIRKRHRTESLSLSPFVTVNIIKYRSRI